MRAPSQVSPGALGPYLSVWPLVCGLWIDGAASPRVRSPHGARVRIRSVSSSGSLKHGSATTWSASQANAIWPAHGESGATEGFSQTRSPPSGVRRKVLTLPP